MKKLINVLFVCLLTTSFAFACPPDGDGDKKASTENPADAVKMDAKFASLDLKVVGMTCGGCENKVKAALSGMDGVVETKTVSAEGNAASLTYDPTVVSSEEIVKVLGEKTGYSVSILKSAGMVDGTSTTAAKACCASKSGAQKTCTKEQTKSCTKTNVSGESELKKE